MFAALIILFAVGLIVFHSVKIVPQGEEWVVERLGKFNTILHPGLNIVIPVLDTVSYKVSTKDIILDIPTQEVITKDNAVILSNAIAFIKVTNVQRAVYSISNFQVAMENMVQTSLRSIIGGMTLNDALTSRETIKSQLKANIADEAADWGLTVKSVEIQDIRPSENMQSSMEKQASAERERIALETNAQGRKTAAILDAQAKLEAAKLEAEGQKIAAEASALAIQTIANALRGNETASTFLLGDRYIQNMEKISSSINAKTVVLPGDITSAIKSLVGSK